MNNKEMKEFKDYLEAKRLEVMDLELNARRQAALTSVKRDFIEECNINDEYMRLLEIEKEKYQKELLKRAEVKEVLDNIQTEQEQPVEDGVGN